MKHDGIKGIIESRRAPGLSGLDKGSRTRHQVEVLRPRPYDDSVSQLRAIEDSGKMTPALREHGKEILKGLKDDKAAGKHTADYYSKGHPVERPGGIREGVLDQ